MDQLIERVLAVRAGLAPDYGTGLVAAEQGRYASKERAEEEEGGGGAAGGREAAKEE